MNFTDEQFAVIGEPTELFVQESVGGALSRDGGQESVDVAAVVEELRDFPGLSTEEAHDRIAQAVVAGDVDCVVFDDGTTGLTLHPMTYWRLWRRHGFWKIVDELGLNVQPHFPNECAVVRAAVLEWRDGYDEDPTQDDLLDTVMDLTGYRDAFAGMHVILNALDAGAVVCERESEGCWTLRFRVVDGWVQQ